MSILLCLAESHYDLVIVDGPPVLGIADTPILARLVKTTLFVVSHNQVSRAAAVDAVKRLRRAGANLVGATMTSFDSGAQHLGGSLRYMKHEYYTYGDRRLLAARQNEESNGGETDMVTPLGDNVRRFRRTVARRFERAA